MLVLRWLLLRDVFWDGFGWLSGRVGCVQGSAGVGGPIDGSVGVGVSKDGKVSGGRHL